MLSHCANPQCSKPFLRLREGKLFLMETRCGTRPLVLTELTVPGLRKPPRRVEHFWLCDQCASVWTLIDDGHRGITLVPLKQPSLSGRRATAEDPRETVLASQARLSISVAKIVPRRA